MAEIRYQVDDGIAVVTIDRPERRNAMTKSMTSRMRRLIAAASADDGVRAIVLTGVPGAFCAGTDLADLASTPTDERSGHDDGGDDWTRHSHTLLACAKPLIAAVDGPAVGMGAEFTSMCDARLASPNARFAWNFGRRGLVPDTGAGTWLLPRLIGVTAALDLLLSGDFIDAARARELGYVNDVVESEELLPAAVALARRLSQGSPFAAKRSKELLYRGLGRDFDEHLAVHLEMLEECFQSDDHREGVASFLEKRDPVFTGR
jgi:enoyl-CoA hydratase/carnithine racemase